MEDLKLIKEITYFVLTVVLVIGFILLIFKWKENLEKRSELFAKESELIELKKANTIKDGKLYDQALKQQEGNKK